MNTLEGLKLALKEAKEIHDDAVEHLGNMENELYEAERKVKLQENAVLEAKMRCHATEDKLEKIRDEIDIIEKQIIKIYPL